MGGVGPHALNHRLPIIRRIMSRQPMLQLPLEIGVRGNGQGEQRPDDDAQERVAPAKRRIRQARHRCGMVVRIVGVKIAHLMNITPP